MPCASHYYVSGIPAGVSGVGMPSIFGNPGSCGMAAAGGEFRLPTSICIKSGWSGLSRSDWLKYRLAVNGDSGAGEKPSPFVDVSLLSG